MTRNRGGIGTLLLAGLAAFGLYKYSKMSEDEKRNLKEKGKKLVDENLNNLKNVFGNQSASNTSNGQHM